VNIDLIAPSSLQAYDLETLYLPLLKKTLLATNHSMNVLVDVNITTNQTIRKYNAMYRKKDMETDVLSFAFLENAKKIKGQPIHLGQLIISYQKAFSQAAAYGHSRERELSFLFVHGLLHLLGYNHETASDEQKMLVLQDKILGKRVKK
jgi:probable rRNA maturation factor